MTRIARPALVVVVVVLLASSLFAGQRSADEKQVWSLEQSYWQYVQANDLERYRTLWHPDFLGWPLSNPEPARKDHITDWIGVYTSKGDTLKSYEIGRASCRERV